MDNVYDPNFIPIANRSIFFIPVRYNNFEAVKEAFENDKRWTPEKPHTDAAYLFPNASKIINESKMFCSYVLQNPDMSNVYMYAERLMQKNLTIDPFPVVNKVRFSGFATNVGFLEYHVEYDQSLSIENILNFAYYFKKASPKMGIDLYGKKPLYNYSNEILPQDSSLGFELFFTSEQNFKKECKCFHNVIMEEAEAEGGRLQDVMRKLARNYKNNFILSADCGDNDVLFSPYSYSNWSGSPDALANVIVKNDKYRQAQKYMEKYFGGLLSRDFYYTYLILLNQRFSLLNYLDMLSKDNTETKNKFDSVCKQSMKLITYFSFRIISDDLQFQGIYSKMYAAMNIDELIEDIEDNEKIVSNLYAKKSERHEEIMSTMLVCISFLSLFSALVDASGFFDRVNASPVLSTILSILCVVAILMVGVNKLCKKEKKASSRRRRRT